MIEHERSGEFESPTSKEVGHPHPTHGGASLGHATQKVLLRPLPSGAGYSESRIQGLILERTMHVAIILRTLMPFGRNVRVCEANT